MNGICWIWHSGGIDWDDRYHTVHHEIVERNFSIFGIWTDNFCKSVELFLIGDDRKEVDRVTRVVSRV